MEAELSSEEYRQLMTIAQLREIEEAHLARRCYVCGEADESNGGSQGILTYVEVCIARDEEDHSETNRWLCEHHLRIVSKVLVEVGLGNHYHTGFNHIQREDCDGFDLPYDCPEPENRYGERV